MDMITAFFSVNTIAFTILGYSISWLELVGTIFNLVCVILAARRNIWNWPIGLIGVMQQPILGCGHCRGVVTHRMDCVEPAHMATHPVPGTSITTASRRRLHHDRLRRAVPHDAPQA